MTGNKAVANHHFTDQFENLQITYEKIRVIEPLVTEDLQKNIQEKGTKLTGLEYASKTSSSIEDKINREMAKDPETIPEDYLMQMKDLIRYTEIDDYHNLIPSAKETIKNLEAQGYVLSGIKNYYIKPYETTGYMGLHLNFVSPYGQEIEYQVHSEESFKAKQDGHKLYEQIRTSVLDKDKDRLIKEILEIHGRAPIPPDFETLPDYAMDPSKKRELIDLRKDRIDVDIDISDDTNSMVYDVSCDGERIYHGFEHKFTDGSLWAYRNNDKSGTSVLHSLSNEGDEIAKNGIKAIHPSLEQLQKEAQLQEKKHTKWIEKNLPDIDDRDDVSKGTDKAKGKSISAMQLDFIH